MNLTINDRVWARFGHPGKGEPVAWHAGTLVTLSEDGKGRIEWDCGQVWAYFNTAIKAHTSIVHLLDKQCNRLTCRHLRNND